MVPLTIAPIASEHDTQSFDCGETALDDWLKARALKNESRFSRTYVICDGSRIIGFYSISAGSVERASTPGKVRRNAPDAVPVVVIGRLAVCRSAAGQGLGSALLADALRRILAVSESIGVAAVLVHAKDQRARAFYMACAEFLEFPADSRILFLPIETLAEAAR